jgi:hypothetical protein
LRDKIRELHATLGRAEKMIQSRRKRAELAICAEEDHAMFARSR